MKFLDDPVGLDMTVRQLLETQTEMGARVSMLKIGPEDETYFAVVVLLHKNAEQAIAALEALGEEEGGE
jgi:hypothetical protein